MPPNRQLDPGPPVLIYGAGQFARAVAGALQQLGVPVAGFVVTTPEVATLMDCPVWSWSSQADGVAAFLAEHPGVEVEIMPLALADRSSYGVLCGQGEGAALSSVVDGIVQQGSMVHAVRADDLYPALRVDVVKIDAEGSDLACIEGMAGILSRSRPVVAVAVYHRAEDLIEIPLALERILGRQGYRYHLRQHPFNSFDCVLYAVPQP